MTGSTAATNVAARPNESRLNASTNQRLVFLVVAFLLYGAAYPALRVELMDWLGIPSPILGSWVDLLCAAVLLTLLVRSGKGIAVAPATVFVWGILASGVISIFVGNFSERIVYGVRLTYMPMIFFFAGCQLGTEWHYARRILNAVLAIAGISAVAGVLLTVVFPEYWTSLFTREVADSRGWGVGAIEREFGLRMTGLLLDPVVFGTLCAWGFAIGLNRLLTPGNRRSVLLLITMAFMLIGVLLSLSRGAWVAAFIAVAVTVVLRPAVLLSAKFVLVTILLVTAGAYVGTREEAIDVITVLNATLEKTIREGNLQRQSQFEGVISNLSAYPLGQGLGNVGHVGERFSDDGYTREGFEHITDGWYLKLLAEGGIPLALLFIAFLASLHLALIRALLIEHDPQRRALLSGILGICAAASVQGFVSNVWDLYFLSQTFWLLAGIGLSVSFSATDRNGTTITA